MPRPRALQVEALEDRCTPSLAEFVDPHPAAGNKFGDTVLPLSTGNVVITAPGDDAGGTDAGAVYLFNGATGALLSTLRGTSASDSVGSGGVFALTNGNYVVSSPGWKNGAAAQAGAATWGSGTTGVAGTVSAANSLVGTSAFDQVGSAVIALASGNYVVSTPFWDNGAAANAGAATWGSGTTGVVGPVSVANSLVGSTSDDRVGINGTPDKGVVALPSGNYLVSSSLWNTGGATDAGAVTFGNGTTGVVGVISAANSLVGSLTGDRVGGSFFANATVTILPSGNYVVRSEEWHNVGAATFGSGTAGVVGVVSAANSLVGSTASDGVGRSVIVLTNGNYVVNSPSWDDGAATNAGAVTFGSGTAGVVGTLSAANSLVGTTAGDTVGGRGVAALTNGNYVVSSPQWDNGGAVNAGAATWGNGTSGVAGPVSAANSLVGNAGDGVSGSPDGGGGVTALTNGNYVVNSPHWKNAGADVGAVTWGNGATGIVGLVSAANSLVGSTDGDSIGRGGLVALTNGNYVVCSPFWRNNGVGDTGAATFGNGATGVVGAVTAANSLVGSGPLSRVSSGSGFGGVVPLTNGNYVVLSPYWTNGRGAATWGSGTTGVVGLVSAANSLVGSTSDDLIGFSVVALTNGNYVVGSSQWDNGGVANVGAATFGSGTAGVVGVVSAANSLVGSTANDQVGGSVVAMPNGNYVVVSRLWDNGALANAGAVTFGNGTSGVAGPVAAANNTVGRAANTNLSGVVIDNVNGTIIPRFVDQVGGHFVAGSQVTGFGTPTTLSVSLSVSATAGTEAAGTTITVTATAGGPVTGNATVTLVVTGAGITAGDFTLSGVTITIPNGQATGSVTFTVVNDADVEAVETATLTISNPSPNVVLGGTVSQTVAITSDDGNPPPPPPPGGTTPLAVGGANGSVAVFAASNGQYAPAATVAPFAGFTGGVRTATSDIDGDGVADLVAVTGPGTPIRVAVVSGADNSTVLVAPFDPFGGDFTGGGFVSAADLDRDGKAEYAVTPDEGGGPRVSIFSLSGGSQTLRANFFGIDDPNFRGGARSALGDVNGDGTPDMAVSAGFLGGPRTALFDGATLLGTPTRLIADFFAFPGSDAETLRNGVFVAAGDVDGDGFAELIFGGGPGGAPRVFVLSGAKLGSGDVAGAQSFPVANYFVAGNADDRGGVRLAVKNADADAKADVVAGSGEGRPSKVRIYLGANFSGAGEPTTFQDLDPFAATLPGGVFVG